MIDPVLFTPQQIGVTMVTSKQLKKIDGFFDKYHPLCQAIIQNAISGNRTDAEIALIFKAMKAFNDGTLVEVIVRTPRRHLPINDHLLDMQIELITDNGISQRTQWLLRCYSFISIRALVLITEEELRSLPGFGEEVIQQLRTLLDRFQLTFGMLDPPHADDRSGAILTKTQQAALFKPANELIVTVKTEHDLFNGNIRLIGELVQRTQAQLLGIKGMNTRSLREIKTRLAEMDLRLAMKLDIHTMKRIAGARAQYDHEHPDH